GDFFSSSFYVSGLVLDVPLAKSIARRLCEMAPTNPAIWLYPQTAFAIELMLQRHAIWLDIQLTQKSEQLPSLIKDMDGSAYHYLESRWRQHLAWLRYFDELCGQPMAPHSSLDQMRRSLQSSLYDRLLEAMDKESPESANAFRRGAYQRECQNPAEAKALETKLDNFRGMIRRRDEKIAKLKAKLKSKS
ncbi:MAG: hypothetical protein KDK97_03225, partial [Verrucomicrobiales bacterium]|nr:hypothetical protein [Verrucomicrobiales bacterium]